MKTLEDIEKESIRTHYEPQTQDKVFGSKSRLLKFADDVSIRTSNDYLIKDVIGIKSFVTMYGPPSSGKTFLAVDIAHALAANRETWYTRKIKHCSVLYVCLEGVSGFKRRLAAVREVFGLSKNCFAYLEDSISLGKSDIGNRGLKKIIETAQELTKTSCLETQLIIIDTLARAMSGDDENSAADMSGFVSKIEHIIRQTGATVLIIHHSGKDTDKGMRGSSALLGACDTVIKVAPDNDNFKAEIEKSKDGEVGPLIRFKLRPMKISVDDDGDDIKSCVIERIEKKADTKSFTLTGYAKDVLNEFDHIENKRRITKHDRIPDGAMVVSEYQFIEACWNKGIGTSSSNDPVEVKKIRIKAIKRGIETCKKKGALEHFTLNGEKVFWRPDSVRVP